MVQHVYRDNIVNLGDFCKRFFSSDNYYLFKAELNFLAVHVDGNQEALSMKNFGDNALNELQVVSSGSLQLEEAGKRIFVRLEICISYSPPQQLIG